MSRRAEVQFDVPSRGRQNQRNYRDNESDVSGRTPSDAVYSSDDDAYHHQQASRYHQQQQRRGHVEDYEDDDRAYTDEEDYRHQNVDNNYRQQQQRGGGGPAGRQQPYPYQQQRGGYDPYQQQRGGYDYRQQQRGGNDYPPYEEEYMDDEDEEGTEQQTVDGEDRTPPPYDEGASPLAAAAAAAAASSRAATTADPAVASPAAVPSATTAADQQQPQEQQTAIQGDKPAEDKKQRDLSDDYHLHRFGYLFPPVELPLKIVTLALQDCRHEAPGSAHRWCFTFFAYGARRTTHRVRSWKPVVLLMTYESFSVLDAETGELVRIIPLNTLLSPIYCVLGERILHLKVSGEHDLVFQFSEKHVPSHSVDLLCDMIVDLHYQMALEDLGDDESQDGIQCLEVMEVPTSAQLVNPELDRRSDYSYPQVRLKELLRFENQDEEEPLVIPENARRQITDTIEEFPKREEKFSEVLPVVRVEDLEKRIALRQKLLLDKKAELDSMREGNQFLNNEYMSLSNAVSMLRTAIQQAHRDQASLVEMRRKRQQRQQAKAQRSALRAMQQPSRPVQSGGGQMQWERGSDEDEYDDQFEGQRPDEPSRPGDDRRSVLPPDDRPAMLDGEEAAAPPSFAGDSDDEEADEDDSNEDEELAKNPKSQMLIRERREKNQLVTREIKRLSRRLLVTRLKLMQAQEQAARLWTRWNRSSELISHFQDVLLKLDFLAEAAAIAEAGATQSKPALEAKNRELKLEYQSLKLLDRVTDDRDKNVVKAETEVMMRKKDLEDRVGEEDKYIEDHLRPIRIEHERHIAELTQFFAHEIAKATAVTKMEFGTLLQHARSQGQKLANTTLEKRAESVVLEKVNREVTECIFLRDELQKKSKLVSSAIVSLQDENEGLKTILDDLMKEHSMSLEAHQQLQTRLVDAQRSLAEERDVRRDILERTKHKVVEDAKAVLKSKEEEIVQTRRKLFELQDLLQRAARSFGLGGAFTSAPLEQNPYSSAHFSARR